ncbi:MAG: TonB-dependent receptor [Acidobacteriota bacterium]
MLLNTPLSIILTTFLLVSSTSGSSQAGAQQSQQNQGAVSGQVKDERGDTIGSASIFATAGDRPEVTAQTDSSGRYRLALAPGDYLLRAEARGFAQQVKRVTVEPRSDLVVDWALAIPVLPDVVTVTPARVERRLEELPVSVTVLGARDVENAAAQTLDDLLRQVPGFSIFRRSSSLVANPTTQGVSLRGAGASGASRTLVLADGLPLNDAFGGWVYWDRIPRAAVEQVEVVRGGSSDLYGSDALSGVINLITRTPSAPVLNAEVSYGNHDTSDLSLFAGGTWHDWSINLSGEATRTDGYFIVAPERRGPIDEYAASKHRSLNLRLAKGWGGTAGKAPNSVFVRGALFDEDRKNGTPVQRNDTTGEFAAAGFRLQSPDKSNWQFSLFGNQQRFHQSFTAVTADRARETLTRLQAVPSRDAGFSFTWSRLTTEKHLLLAGVDLRGVRGVSDEQVYTNGIPTSLVSAGGRQGRRGFFAQDIISLTSRWLVSVSARYDHWRDSSAYSIERVFATGVVRPRFFDERSEDAFSPRVAVLYHVGEGVTLRAAAYRAFRAPTLNELYRSFRVGDTLTVANERLEAERLTGGEAGASWEVGDRMRSRVTGYWTETVNPISNFTLTVTPTLITRERRNLGRTRSRGIEIESDLRLAEDWHLTAGYLFSDTTVLEAPQDSRLVGLWIPQVPQHQFTLQTVYSNPRYITAAMQFRASGRQFDDDQNRLPLDSFSLIDLMAERRLVKTVDAFFAVQNVLNQRYAVGRTPIETIGAPRLFRGGLRIRLGR